MSTYNKENLLLHLKALTPEGYTIDDIGEFKKDEGKRKCTLSFGYQDYFPSDVRFDGFGVGVCFTEVEDIYHTVSLKNNYSPNHTLDSDTFYKGFREIGLGKENYENKLLGVPVEDDSSFARVRPYLEQMITAGLNFLNQYQTLRDFYDYGESIDGRLRAKFYQDLPPKLLIVKKILDISYSGLASKYIKRFNELSMPDKANFIKALKDHLDKM